MTGSRRRLLVLAAPAFLYLVVVGVVAALYVHLPTLGWIAFGVACLVCVALTAGAVALLPRLRMKAARQS